MVTLVCLQTNVCQTWALHFVGFQTSDALNEGLFLSREFLEEIVPCFMALFPCFHTLLHCHFPIKTVCIRRAVLLLGVKIKPSTLLHCIMLIQPALCVKKDN